MNRLANNLLAVFITLVVLGCLLLTGCTAFEAPYEPHGQAWHDVYVKRSNGSPFDPSTRMMK